MNLDSLRAQIKQAEDDVKTALINLDVKGAREAVLQRDRLVQRLRRAEKRSQRDA